MQLSSVNNKNKTTRSFVISEKWERKGEKIDIFDKNSFRFFAAMERKGRRGRPKSKVDYSERNTSPQRKSPSRNSTGRKSPSRIKKRSPSRSPVPARRKSPSRIKKRSPSRSPVPARKSPSRLRKSSASPARKSPSRKAVPVKEAKVEKSSPKATRKARTTPREVIENIKIDKEFIAQKMSPKVALKIMKPGKVSPNKSSSSLKLEDSGDIEVSKLTFNIHNLTPEHSQYSNLTPTATDLGTEKSRSMSRSVYDEDSDDDVAKTKRDIASRNLINLFQGLDEFGGRIGALLLSIIVPAVCIYLNYICTKSSCSLAVPDINALLSWRAYVNKEVAIGFVLFSWGISIMSAIPIGRSVKIYVEDTYVEYIFNGISTAVITLLGLFTIEYLKYNVIDLIYNNYFQLSILNILYAFFIGFVSYIRPRYIVEQPQWNPYGRTGKFLTDLYAGREISPKLFRILDIKLVRIRVALLTAFILNAILIYKNLGIPSLSDEAIQGLTKVEIAKHILQHTTYNSTALLTASLLVIYISDLFIFEHHLTNSFELQHEGVGLHFLIRYAVFPFMISLLPKYTFEHQIDPIPLWAGAIIVLGFLFGLYLKRSSNKLKYDYRLNPTNSKFQSKLKFVLI